MRDYWTDGSGKRWRVAPSGKRLNFANLGPQALRAFVYARDGFRCVRCDWMPSAIPTPYDGRYTLLGDDVGGKRRELQLDHVVALHHGGTNHPDNLQTLCFGCNASKGARHGG